MLFAVLACNLVHAQPGAVNEQRATGKHWNTPEAFATFPQPPSALPLASIIVGLVTGVTGTFANAVVFVVFGLKDARVTSGR